MKQEMQQISTSKPKRKMLRVNVMDDIVKRFKMACIQLDMQEFEGAEEALTDWIIAKQKAGKVFLPKPERE